LPEEWAARITEIMFPLHHGFEQCWFMLIWKYLKPRQKAAAYSSKPRSHRLWR
jgi:hypothetical protein